jgi:hypothetical protein
MEHEDSLQSSTESTTGLPALMQMNPVRRPNLI